MKKKIRTFKEISKTHKKQQHKNIEQSICIDEISEIHHCMIKNENVVWYTQKMDVFKIVLELLCSLTLNNKTKILIQQILQCEEKNVTIKANTFLSLLSWPSVWDGICKQVDIDINRCIIVYNKKRYENTINLSYDLQKSFGMYGRFIMIFLNQACMSDVFKCVYDDVNKRYPLQNVFVCDGRDKEFELFFEIVATNNLMIKIYKQFQLFESEELLEQNKRSNIIQTTYIIKLTPKICTTINWCYV